MHDRIVLTPDPQFCLLLGGLHPAKDATVKLDEQAAALGIEKGKTYPLDVFHAERRTDKSNFRIDTTLEARPHASAEPHAMTTPIRRSPQTGGQASLEACFIWAERSREPLRLTA